MASPRRIVITCVGVVALMTGMSFAAVPLYDLFCRVTGFGGTTQQAEGASETTGSTLMKVTFDASLARGMPWKFEPAAPVTLRTGETGLIFYRATNLSDRPVTGTASFNVTPQKAGEYFMKIDCFCFTEQTLQPGQSVDMPVQFYVDPAIEKDQNADEVRTITLSYTFFETQSEGGERETEADAATGGAGLRE
ncbi:MAG: cytochrome c oxidase assembly protein [Minwuia sp.]|uniref:cytochrome c oxidase assembly protein n=1 Tax=Minwuia sp. TaxID=2493630 RepID=UPI003A8C3D3C